MTPLGLQQPEQILEQRLHWKRTSFPPLIQFDKRLCCWSSDTSDAERETLLFDKPTISQTADV